MLEKAARKDDLILDLGCPDLIPAGFDWGPRNSEFNEPESRFKA
jgi:hypothetical protein